LELVPVGVKTFDGVGLEVRTGGSDFWVSGIDVGRALGYKNSQESISNIYRSNRNELKPFQGVIDSITPGGTQKTRFFNRRGVFLLAMFARTDRAVAFRRWVVEVLDALAEGCFVPRAALEVERERVAAAFMKLERALAAGDKTTRWFMDLLRYRQLGLYWSEVAKLLGCAESTAKKYWAIADEAGIVAEPDYSVPKAKPLLPEFEWFMTTTEAAQRLSVSRRTIERMINRGEIPAKRVGGVYRIPVRKLAEKYGAVVS
jgi:excisionase family DNA binding protein